MSKSPSDVCLPFITFHQASCCILLSFNQTKMAFCLLTLPMIKLNLFFLPCSESSIWLSFLVFMYLSVDMNIQLNYMQKEIPPFQLQNDQLCKFKLTHLQVKILKPSFSAILWRSSFHLLIFLESTIMSSIFKERPCIHN